MFWCRHHTQDFLPYKLLLVDPRSLFTHLFPAVETKLLLIAWTAMTGIQFVLFMLWDVNEDLVAGMMVMVMAMWGSVMAVDML